METELWFNVHDVCAFVLQNVCCCCCCFGLCYVLLCVCVIFFVVVSIPVLSVVGSFSLVCPYLVTGLRQMYRKTVNKNEPLRSREWSTARSHAVSIRYDIYKTFKMCGLCVFSVCMCVNYGFFFSFLVIWALKRLYASLSIQTQWDIYINMVPP